MKKRFNIRTPKLFLFDYAKKNFKRHIHMMSFRKLNKILSIQIIYDCFFIYSLMCQLRSKIFQNPSCSYFQTCPKMFKIGELIYCLYEAFKLTEFLNIVKITKDSFCCFSFLNFQQFFLDIAYCLLRHHCVISFKDRLRTVVSTKLR